MPVYDYKCKECGHEFDLYLSMKDYLKPTKKPCPNCEKTGCVQRKFLPTNFIADKLPKCPKWHSDNLDEIQKQNPGNTMRREIG
jgi:putative FmdB family regulatory protein